jgi:hypothetical protein
MKWTLLKRRSEVQKLEIQVSPVSETYFHPSNSNNSNTTCDDKRDATEIAHKQLLGQMGSMNLVDEEGQETASRAGSNPAFTDPADTVQQLPTFSSDPDAGLQPSFALGAGAHSETHPPENLNAILLQAANVLERVEAHIEQCAASLRYFVDLGSSNRPNDFADVKRNLTDIRTLMNSSAPILLMVRKLAAGFRAFGTLVAASTPNGQGEANCVNIIEVPSEEPRTDSQSTLKVDPIPIREQLNEHKQNDPGSTPNEQGMASSEIEVPVSVLQVNHAPTQEQGNEQKPADPGSSNEQDPPKPVNMVPSQIEVRSPMLHVDSAPIRERSDEQKRADLGSLSNEQNEPKRSEIEIPFDHALIQEQLDVQKRVDPCSTSNQQDQPDIKLPLPTLQVGPTPTQEQQDEQKPVDVGSTSNEQDQANKNSPSTLQVGPTPIQEQSDEQRRVDPGATLQQNEQMRIDMVLSEIQIVLTERPPIQKARIKHGNAALPASERGGLDARLTIASKSTIPLNAHQVERKPNEQTMTDPVTQEIQALLGILDPEN